MRHILGQPQCVYIDGAESSFHGVEVEVPQGSVLGPLFYIFSTNAFQMTAPSVCQKPS